MYMYLYRDMLVHVLYIHVVYMYNSGFSPGLIFMKADGQLHVDHASYFVHAYTYIVHKSMYLSKYAQK